MLRHLAFLVLILLVTNLGIAGGADAPPKVGPATDLHGDPLPAGARGRLGSVRFHHPSACVAYSPDGKLLASGGSDNSIRLFDAATGRVVRDLVGHQARTYNAPRKPRSPVDLLVSAVKEGQITTLAFSPDGKTLATGGWDDSVRLWDVATGGQVRRLEAHRGMVAAVAFSRDGRYLASRGGIDGIVRIWDPSTGNELRRVEELAAVNPWRFNRTAPLAFSPDSKTLALGDRKVIRFIDPATGKEKARWDAHPVTVSLAYSTDGKHLASGGIDGNDRHSLRIWDTATGKEAVRCKLPKDEPPIFEAFSPDGKLLAAVVEEDDMHLFDTATGKPIHRLKHYWASRLAFAPDGKTLASARGPVVRLWDPATGKERFTDFKGHKAGVTAVAVAPDGKIIASGGENILLWDAATSRLLRSIEVRGGVAALAFSPNGKTLVSAGRDRIVHLWDVSTGKQSKELKGHKLMLCGLALSPDGKRLASGDVQSTIKIWDLATDKVLRTIDMQSGTEHLALAFTPDSKQLACAGAWNDSSFLPAGGIIIQGIHMKPKEGYRVVLWDVSTGKEARTFAGLTDKLKSLAISPDGQTLAASSQDGRLALWDLASGKDRLFILAHPRHVPVDFSASPALAFSPDGQTLASASTDKTVRLWDVKTAKEVERFEGPGGFTTLAFPRDGKSLVTGSSDTNVLIWDLMMPKPAKRRPPEAIFIQ